MTIKQQTDRERFDRPFPWKCPTCLALNVHPAEVPYTAKIKHDGLVHTIHLPCLEIPKCQQCGELIFNDRADEQIDEALRSQLRLLAPAQIRQYRKELELNQSEFADRLGVADATISRWETGALIQSRAMDNLLRLYFALPAVRDVLRGANQDPLLGTDKCQLQPARSYSVTSMRLDRFTFAREVYGDDALISEVSMCQNRRSLLSIGRG